MPAIHFLGPQDPSPHLSNGAGKACSCGSGESFMSSFHAACRQEVQGATLNNTSECMHVRLKRVHLEGLSLFTYLAKGDLPWQRRERVVEPCKLRKVRPRLGQQDKVASAHVGLLTRSCFVSGRHGRTLALANRTHETVQA